MHADRGDGSTDPERLRTQPPQICSDNALLRLEEHSVVVVTLYQGRIVFS